MLKRTAVSVLAILIIFFVSCDKDEGGDPPQNIYPEITSFTSSVSSVHPGIPVDVSVTASDTNGDELTYSYQFMGGLQGTITGTGPDVTVTLSSTGQHDLQVTVSDGNGGSASEFLSITGVNNNPVITNIISDNTEILIGSTVNITVTASDADADSLTYEYNVDTGGNIIPSGNTASVEINSVGDNVVSAVVRDSFGGSDYSSITVTGTMSTPSITAMTAGSTLIQQNESTSVTCTAVGGTGSLSYWFSAIEGYLVQSGNNATYTASGFFSGIDVITVQVTDSVFNQTEDTLSIRINQKPSISSSGVTFATIGKGMTTELSATVYDEENDPVYYAWSILSGTGTITGSGPAVYYTTESYGDHYIEVSIGDTYWTNTDRDTVHVFCEPQWQPVPEVNAIAEQFLDIATYNSGLYVTHNTPDSAVQLIKYNGTSWDNIGASFSGSGWNVGKLMLTGSDMYMLNSYFDWSVFMEKRAVYKFNGSGWNVHAPLGDGGSTDWFDAAAYGSVIYQAYSNSKTVVERFDGSWSIIGDSLSLGDSYTNSIAVDPNGNVYLAFVDNEDNDPLTDDILKVMKWSGVSWSTIGNGFTDGEALGPVIKMNGDIPYIAFQDRAHSDRVTVMYYDGAWNTVGDPGFPYWLGGTGDPDPVMGGIDFVFDGDDIYCGYQQTGLTGLNKTSPSVMKWNGSEWTLVGIKHVTGTTPCFGMKIVIDSNGIPNFITAKDDRSYSTVYKFE